MDYSEEIDEFKEISREENYSEKVTKIASKLAIEKYNSQKGKNINLEMEINDNIKLVSDKINSVKEEMEKIIPGLRLPLDIEETIAEYLLMSIDGNGLQQLNDTTSMSITIFKEVVLPSKDKNEVLAYMQENHEKGISNQLEYDTIDEIFKIENAQVEMIKEKWSNIGEIIYIQERSDGTTMVFTNPDENSFVSQTDFDNEKEITELENKAYKEFERNRFGNQKTTEEDIQICRENMHGNGIDAYLRDTYSNLILYGVREIIDGSNNYATNRMNLLLEAINPQNANKNGYIEDQYTMIIKMGIYSRIMNDPYIDQNSEQMKCLKEKMREADAELYELIEKDPLILEKIQTSTQEPELLNAVIKHFETTDSISRDEFLDNIRTFSRNSTDLKFEKKYINTFADYQKQYEEEYRNYKLREERKAGVKPKSIEEKLKNKKIAFRRISKDKGVGIAVNSFFTKQMLESDSGETLQMIHEFFDPDNSNPEENFIELVNEDDIKIMTNRLNVLIENQSNKTAPYICELGKLIKELSERKKTNVISSENVDVKSVIENISGNASNIFGEQEKIDEGR